MSAIGEGEARTLAGDEILPILCYIIAHADVVCLGVVVELMMGVCDPTVLNGESGYYLTVLHAALTVSAEFMPLLAGCAAAILIIHLPV